MTVRETDRGGRAGVSAGCRSALALGRAGHEVTVLERDPLPARADAEEAFAAERRGAPQVHQTHGFLARIFVRAARALPRRPRRRCWRSAASTMPMTADLGEPQPGDEDLKVLIVRRTTFEWVLRRAARRPTRRRASAPARPSPGSSPSRRGDGPPVVTGVRLEDGTRLEADVGRRRRPGCAATCPAGSAPSASRCPRRSTRAASCTSRAGTALPESFTAELDPKLGGDLGFVKYLGVPGDARHPLDHPRHPARRRDRCARRSPSPTRFEEACRHPARARPVLPPTGRSSRSAACGRWAGCSTGCARFVDDDGRPLVLGFHAVGDAHTCTNPLYGRGCSLALVQALLLARRARRPPGRRRPRGPRPTRPAARARSSRWFEASVQMDQAGADPKGCARRGQPGGQGARRRCSWPPPPTRSSAGAWPGSGTCWPPRST